MILSYKKSIFLVLLACFQIFLFFTSSTLYELIVISLFMVFLLFYFYYFKLKVTIDFKVGLIWIGLLISLLISSIFTHSFPLSLDVLILHISTFCIFIFFRSLGEIKLFSKFELAATFLLVGLVLSEFFIVFFSFPNLSKFLPIVNNFVSIHGHHHFAAILLFIIPLGWWFVYSEKHTFFKFKQSILVLFYVLLFFTFGRFAIFLSLLQVPFLYGFVRKKKFKKLNLYFIGSVLFLVIVLAVLSFSLSDKSCLGGEFENQVCKPISKEVRPEYYKQAFLGFKSSPLFGYGPGTFSLITKKFNVIALYNSIYTHNTFFQVFAESGFFTGTIYLLLIIFLFKNMFLAITKIKKSDEDNYVLNSLIFLGLINLLLNSLIDYDWSKFSVYQMTIMFIALVLWDYPKNKKIRNFNLPKFVWVLLVSTLIILGIISAATQALIFNKRHDLAFKIFPYFYLQSEEFRLENNLSSSQRESLYKIYKNEDRFILKNIEDSPELERKIELYEDLVKNKPFEIINKNYHQALKDSGNFDELGIVTQKGLALLMEIENQGFIQSYDSKREVFEYLLESIAVHKEKGEWEIANRYYSDIQAIWDSYESNEETENY